MKSVILYGPPASGKSMISRGLANVLGLSKIIDPWKKGDPIPAEDHLLVSQVPSSLDIDAIHISVAKALSFTHPIPVEQPKIYPHASYDALVQKTIDEILRLSSVKGGEYAGDEDRLANFRRNAEKNGVQMTTIWAVYLNKHLDAIQQWVQDLQTGKTRPRAESISGRMDDAIVYLILGKAIVEELEVQPAEPPKPVFVTGLQHGDFTPKQIPGETAFEAAQRYHEYLQSYHGPSRPWTPEQWAKFAIPSMAKGFEIQYQHWLERIKDE